MIKTRMIKSIKSLYQAGHQEEFLHLQAQAESLLQELEAHNKQNQLAADESTASEVSLADQSESNEVS